MKPALLSLPLLLGLTAWSGPFDRCGGGDDDPSASPAPAERPPKPVQRRAPGPVQALRADHLCVTTGGLAKSPRGRIQVDGPKMRSVAPGSSGDVGELRFLYRGPTEKVAPLASGQIRRQVGLKLRAENGCNLIYAMWRIEPKPGIEVQIKRNRGQRVNSECGNRGYRKLAPRRQAPVPLLQPGSEHTLRAEIKGQDLVVWADGVLVWEGDLGPEANVLSGPVGMRSDNVALELELLSDLSAQDRSLAAAKVPGRCSSVSDGD
jgi:hypothetical protein